MKKYIENDVVYFKFEDLLEYDWLDHAFTSKFGLNIDEDIKNEFKCDRIINLNQVHGTEVLKADNIFCQEYKSEAINMDGVVTNVKDIIIRTTHADCTPVFFIDDIKKTIGLCHAGWKGTYGNITKKTIELMINSFGSKVEDIKVLIGPAIGVCCYEVSEDLYYKFFKKYGIYKNAFELKEDKYYIDLKMINYFQALEIIGEKSNIINSNICTSCNNNYFYSYRKDKATGRMKAIMLIKS